MDCYDAPSGIGFGFAKLWSITQSIKNACSDDDRLFHDQTRLTNAACDAIAGAGWTRYSVSSVWYRLTLWTLPLLQLVSLFSRPPLGWRVETFAIIHLVGNPINTIWSLLYKLAVCQSRAKYWRNAGRTRECDRPDHEWKALTLVAVSYDEWGEKGADKRAVTLCRLLEAEPVLCKKAASALAADRATRFLPVLVAQSLFISAIVTSFVRVSANPSDPLNPMNVEAHSIAFSAIYFWVIPATFLSSVVGVSQTENSMPNILEALRGNGLPDESLQDAARRVREGGVYSWQPRVWQLSRTGAGVSSKRRAVLGLLSLLSVIAGAFSAGLLSGLTPPVGLDCRHYAQAAILSVYLISALLDIPIEHFTHKQRFWWAFAKDLLATALNITITAVVRVGFFNRCLCWTQFGRVGLTLPEEPAVAEILATQFKGVFLFITIGCILSEVLFCFFISLWFRDAFKVFMQRDDGKSNVRVRGWRKLGSSRGNSGYMEMGAVGQNSDPETEHTDTKNNSNVYIYEEPENW